ncbi:hypothetical protein HMPREF9999_02038 [Alloprevotella sp. oral taxon 473 str. F0040]|nr:hypothetical protein HMPREF9999_02038 [Alloprevotella sp. oral taxon 473 str. F0040]
MLLVWIFFFRILGLSLQTLGDFLSILGLFLETLGDFFESLGDFCCNCRNFGEHHLEIIGNGFPIRAYPVNEQLGLLVNDVFLKPTFAYLQFLL